MKLSETALSLQHILGNHTEHQAWHSSFPDKERECPFCEMLRDLEALQISAHIQEAKWFYVNFLGVQDEHVWKKFVDDRLDQLTQKGTTHE